MPDVAYLSLADELEQSVRRADAGRKLPSEYELADRHGVSRITTRAALQELERRQLVVRRRGAGTFVAPRIDYPITPNLPPSFTETVRAAGHRPDSRVLSMRRARPTARVRDDLGLATGQRVTVLRRVSLVDDHETGVHTSWLAHVDPARIRDVQRDGRSLFAALADAGYPLHRDWYTAEQATIPAAVAETLGLEGRPQAWHTFSCNRCHRTGQLIELNESWVRADVIRVRFELGPNPPPTV